MNPLTIWYVQNGNLRQVTVYFPYELDYENAFFLPSGGQHSIGQNQMIRLGGFDKTAFPDEILASGAVGIDLLPMYPDQTMFFTVEDHYEQRWNISYYTTGDIDIERTV